MIWKKAFTIGLISTVLSTIACLVYAKIYTEAFYVDFSAVVGTINMISACAIGCFLMVIGYKFAAQWKGEKAVAWLNIIYGVLSFASIAGVLGFNLPLDMESPEMFPGMVIPMHFFPLIAVLSVYPFFSVKD